ncbi:MAG: FixH family protein [Magnetococcales bacterium]|nr:FixH family protein [Magnetococcales bacterium]MBF0438503.1 FixH family protein [Magnetococcales bacterium]
MEKRFAFRLEPWPTSIILFFVAVFVVNGVFIYLGLSTWPGLVTEGAYTKGLAFNQVLKAQQAQDALGWQGTLDASHLSAGQEGRLIFSIRDQQGQPLPEARIQGILVRPVQQGVDQTFTMTQKQPGVYESSLLRPLPGHWDVKLNVLAMEKEYHFVQKINLQTIKQGD